MYYCIATLRDISHGVNHEFTILQEGKTKGTTLAGIYNAHNANIIFLEELSKVDFDLLYNCKIEEA